MPAKVVYDLSVHEHAAASELPDGLCDALGYTHKTPANIESFSNSCLRKLLASP